MKHTHLVFSGPLKVTPAVFSQFHPEQSQPSITEELQSSPKLPRVNPLITVANNQVLNIENKTQLTLLSRGGREQKEERKRGGGGRVGKESVCLCVKGGGGLCDTEHVLRGIWTPACVGVCFYWHVGKCVSSTHTETYVCLGGERLSNSLPRDIRSIDSLSAFNPV